MARGCRMVGSHPADEGAPVGYSDDLLILTHESEIRAADPTFELYDGRRGLSYWVLVVPTPRVAARLLAQHGGPLAEEHVRS
jgi:hypothetical protein